MLAFNIAGQKMKRTDDTFLANMTSGYLQADFVFDEMWNGYKKTVIFIEGGKAYSVPIIYNTNIIDVPHEVLDGFGFDVSVFGVNENGVRITTNIVNVPLENSGYMEGETPGEPTPDVYTKLLAAVRTPIISDNNTWMVVNAETGEYYDTEISATGPLNFGEGKNSTILNRDAGGEATADYSTVQGAKVMFVDNGDGTYNETYSETEAGFIANNTASGKGSHAEGAGTVASGVYSHAEGRANAKDGKIIYTEAAGKASHAEGHGTKTTKDAFFAHSEGWVTTAEGNSSHAEGRETVARGKYAHSEGFNTLAKGEQSHSEGGNTEANGIQSHAEGGNTIANGTNSHAEGKLSTANGYGSHAEGIETETKGQYAHSEGKSTLAEGNSSHTEGFGTRTKQDYQHAEGTYNADNAGALLMVGNGSSDNNRKNAFEVLRDGSATVAYQGTTDNSVVQYAELLKVQNMIKNIVLLNYPIGSIYMSVDSQNPSKLFGGTWEAWGGGRVPVGVGTYTDTDGITTPESLSLDAPDKSGGWYTKTLAIGNIPPHTHTYSKASNVTGGVSSDSVVTYVPVETGEYSTTGTVGVVHTHSISLSTATTGKTPNDGAYNNPAFSRMQPYITCYMWKRIG